MTPGNQNRLTQIKATALGARPEDEPEVDKLIVQHWVSGTGNSAIRRILSVSKYRVRKAILQAQAAAGETLYSYHGRTPKPDKARPCSSCGGVHTGNHVAYCLVCYRVYRRALAKRHKQERREEYLSNIQKWRAERVRATQTGNVSHADWQKILEDHGHKCFYCGSRGALTRDHYIPLSRGGAHHPSNIKPACNSCNCSKGGKLPEEFDAYRASVSS